jgi:glycerol-3-phosphate dehydrogenase
MWTRGWRDRIWEQLGQPWDLIVVGGGITGAGLLREATHLGFRTLLVEADDFASGTSSRSSKLIHGGLRYLRHLQIGTTIDSVRERERLLREGRGLVGQLPFLMPSFEGDRLPGWLFGIGLALYDLLALKWRHRHYPPRDLVDLCPPLRREGLLGGYRYLDAQTDDARLVLRVLREAVADGGTALNYAHAETLLRDRSGRVQGVGLVDRAPEGSGRSAEALAPLVVNAAGAWADGLRAQAGAAPRLRLLRGSHLLFPFERLPLPRAVGFLHPADGRPVFVFPWEGVTLIGTTDIALTDGPPREPAITPEEAHYLMQALHHGFPDSDLSPEDVQATFAGIRSVLDTGQANPSRESREAVLWLENGLMTVTGGKLTTFRRMAVRALRFGRRRLTRRVPWRLRQRMLEAPPPESCLEAPLAPAACTRLVGRYGADAPRLAAAAQPGEFTPIGDGVSLWAELRWAARAEGVVHLDDLLGRRVRLGLLLPQGGLPWLGRIRTVVQSELGWDDARWEAEEREYRRLWQQAFSAAPWSQPPAG